MFKIKRIAVFSTVLLLSALAGTPSKSAENDSANYKFGSITIQGTAFCEISEIESDASSRFSSEINFDGDSTYVLNLPRIGHWRGFGARTVFGGAAILKIRSDDRKRGTLTYLQGPYNSNVGVSTIKDSKAYKVKSIKISEDGPKLNLSFTASLEADDGDPCTVIVVGAFIKGA